MESNITTALVIVGLFTLVYGGSFLKSRKLKQLKKILAAGEKVLFVDVRTSGEYREGHLDSAINVPLEAISKAGKKLGSKDRTIVLYCASGARSRAALVTLKRMGYSKVYNGGTLPGLQGLLAG